jgi:hypothetical protein
MSKPTPPRHLSTLLALDLTNCYTAIYVSEGAATELPENLMPIAAQCPNCGGPLSETSVLALAPVCGRCGTVITKIGGTLGLTSAYGVNDPTITRKRVEADLAVFCDYRNKYVGMLEACKEQLNWGVERYAKLPNPPELLPVKPVHSIVYDDLKNYYGGDFQYYPADDVVTNLMRFLIEIPIKTIVLVVFSPVYLPVVLYDLLAFVITRVENGNRPIENARRQRAYKSACAAALKAAEPVKAAQDHRLRCQIRELDGLIETVTKKAEDVRRILITI